MTKYPIRKYQLAALLSEKNRIEREYSEGTLRWPGRRGKNGEDNSILLSKMDKSYIMNCIELLQKRNPDIRGTTWVEVLIKELVSRGNDWWS